MFSLFEMVYSNKKLLSRESLTRLGNEWPMQMFPLLSRVHYSVLTWERKPSTSPFNILSGLLKVVFYDIKLA
jgi:hypothetical protein